MTTNRIPRPLHPVAWWIWAIGVAIAASRTSNPFVLLILLLSVTCVVLARVQGDKQLKIYWMYVVMGCFIIMIRMVFAIIFGVDNGGLTLFTLPSFNLPDWATGISVGGAVSLQALVAAAIDGLRLATLIIVIGAANALADPRRLLRVIPGALYEVGTAIVVALTIAPQLIDSGIRIRKAQALRLSGSRSGKKPRILKGLIIPVLEDSLDRSLALAASMDTRGYGRWGGLNRGKQKVTSVLVIIGLLGACIGAYGVLDPATSRWLGAPMLIVGVAVGLVGVMFGRARSRPTVYRPDPWKLPETLVVACGIGATVIMFLTSEIDPTNMYPTVEQLVLPSIPLVAIVACVLTLLPAFIAPPVVVNTIENYHKPEPVEDRPADVASAGLGIDAGSEREIS